MFFYMQTKSQSSHYKKTSNWHRGCFWLPPSMWDLWRVFFDKQCACKASCLAWNTKILFIKLLHKITFMMETKIICWRRPQKSNRQRTPIATMRCVPQPTSLLTWKSQRHFSPNKESKQPRPTTSSAFDTDSVSLVFFLLNYWQSAGEWGTLGSGRAWEASQHMPSSYWGLS